MSVCLVGLTGNAKIPIPPLLLSVSLEYEEMAVARRPVNLRTIGGDDPCIASSLWYRPDSKLVQHQSDSPANVVIYAEPNTMVSNMDPLIGTLGWIFPFVLPGWQQKSTG